MKEPTRIFFELMQDDVAFHSEDLAKRVRSTLPKEVLASMTPEQHQALLGNLREGMELVVSSFLGHFDNVGAHLPDGVFGFRILAFLPETSEQPDIREGDADYVDMWQTHLLKQR